MAERHKIYLAGPEVFLASVQEIGLQKQALCARYGFIGEFPLDEEVELKGLSGRDAGLAISAANEALMRDCDLLIANLTPFRGPSADVGTVYEMGFMGGLGRPVLGYSNVESDYLTRVHEELGEGESRHLDPLGLRIEDFGLADNLMLAGALSGPGLFTHPAAADALFTDLSAFEACLAWLRENAEDLLGLDRGR